MHPTRAKIPSILAVFALALGPLPSAFPSLDVTAAFAKNGNGDGNDKGGGKGNGNRNDGNKGGKASGSRDAPGAKGGKPSSSVSKSDKTKIKSTSASKTNHGQIASELKGLNAAHASEQALANASPNSQVGRIAAYRDAARATMEAADALATAGEDRAAAQTALTDAQAALDAYDASYTGRSVTDIDTDISALDPTAPDYQLSLDGLNAERRAASDHEAGRSDLETALADATTAATDTETAAQDAQTAYDGAVMAEDDALMTASNGRTLSDPALDYLRDMLGL